MAGLPNSCVAKERQRTSHSIHSLYLLYRPELNILLLHACHDLATKLWQKRYIDDILYHKIMQKAGVSASPHEMVRAMLYRVYELMKGKDRAVKWNGFIDALKREPIWTSMVKRLEHQVYKAKKEKVEFPEASTLRDNMDMVANTIQGGHLQFANECEAYGVFTLDEKQQFTDPNNNHELTYTQKMLDQVGMLISGGCNAEEVFNGFIKILESIGGPVQAMARFLKEQTDPSAKGAVAVALNQSGIIGAANAAKEAMVKELRTLAVPNPPPMSGIVIPNMESTTVYITVTGGSFKTNTISFTSLQQSSSSGKLSIGITLSGSLMFEKWHEKKVIAALVDRPETSSSFDSSEFNVDFHSITTVANVVVKLNQNYDLQPVISDLKLIGQMFTFTLPGESELGKHNLFTCVSDKIKSVMKEEIPHMTPSIIAKMQEGLNSIFAVIPKSGTLTPDIMFSFSGTPQGLQFPSDNDGVQYRVLGEVFCQGKAAPGDVGVVPFPAIPTNRDAVFNLNDYEFNALFWAFFSKKSLNTSLNATSVKFSPIMNTDYYFDSPLQKAYPNRYLIIDVELVTPPAVTLMVSDKGEEEANITYTANLMYWVAKEGSKTEKDKLALTVSLTAIDVLDGFSVSTNSESGVQLLTFSVTTIKDLDSRLLKSNVPGINPKEFEPMWKSTLHPAYTLILDKAAQTGVPLPSVLNGIFIDYDVQICSGCISVAVNFESKSKYLHLLKTRYGIVVNQKVYPNFSY